MATKALISADAALLSSGLQILDQIRDHLRLEYGPEGLSEDHMIDQMAVAIFKSTRFNSAESGIFHAHVKSYLDRTRDEQSSSTHELTPEEEAQVAGVLLGIAFQADRNAYSGCIGLLSQLSTTEYRNFDRARSQLRKLQSARKAG
jgi:hypothetical protein